MIWFRKFNEINGWLRGPLGPNFWGSGDDGDIHCRLWCVALLFVGIGQLVKALGSVEHEGPFTELWLMSVFSDECF